MQIQKVLDMARIPLNDAAKTRYPDTELLSHYNQASLAILGIRPDIMVGSYGDTSKMPNGERVATDPFPFDMKFAQPIADIVSSMAATKDEEHVESGRAEALIKRSGMFMGG